MNQFQKFELSNDTTISLTTSKLLKFYHFAFYCVNKKRLIKDGIRKVVRVGTTF